METAEEYAKVLGIPVMVVFGLSECAAYVRTKKLKNVEFIPLDVIKTRCPVMEITNIDNTVERFEESVQRIVSKSHDEHILIVTHREGLFFYYKSVFC